MWLHIAGFPSSLLSSVLLTSVGTRPFPHLGYTNDVSAQLGDWHGTHCSHLHSCHCPLLGKWSWKKAWGFWLWFLVYNDPILITAYMLFSSLVESVVIFSTNPKWENSFASGDNCCHLLIAQHGSQRAGGPAEGILRPGHLGHDGITLFPHTGTLSLPA